MNSVVEQVIGMEALSGQLALEETGYLVRIVKQDEMMDCQYRANRVHITIEDGKIVKAVVG